MRNAQILLKHIGRYILASARSFNPTRRIFCSYLLTHTYQLRICKISKIDLVALRKNIAEWEIAVKSKFYLREYVKGESAKHMFAVILYIPTEFDFESLPESYLTSLYISIDSQFSFCEIDF